MGLHPARRGEDLGGGVRARGIGALPGRAVKRGTPMSWELLTRTNG